MSRVFTDEDKSTIEQLIRQAQIQPEPTGPSSQYPEPNWWRTQEVQSQQAPSSQVGDEWTKEGRKRRIEKEDRQQLEDIERKRAEREERLDDTLKALLKYLPSLAQIGATATSAMSGNVPQTLYYLRKLAEQQGTSASEKKELDKLRNEIKRLQEDLEKTKKKGEVESAQESQPQPRAKKGNRKKRGKGVKSGGTRKPNAWVEHCKKVQKENAGMKWGDVLKKAKDSYKK